MEIYGSVSGPGEFGHRLEMLKIEMSLLQTFSNMGGFSIIPLPTYSDLELVMGLIICSQHLSKMNISKKN